MCLLAARAQIGKVARLSRPIINNATTEIDMQTYVRDTDTLVMSTHDLLKTQNSD